MATIKDALDIIGKLTTKDRERLRTMLLIWTLPNGLGLPIDSSTSFRKNQALFWQMQFHSKLWYIIILVCILLMRTKQQKSFCIMRLEMSSEENTKRQCRLIHCLFLAYLSSWKFCHQSFIYMRFQDLIR